MFLKQNQKQIGGLKIPFRQLQHGLLYFPDTASCRRCYWGSAGPRPRGPCRTSKATLLACREIWGHAVGAPDREAVPPLPGEGGSFAAGLSACGPCSRATRNVPVPVHPRHRPLVPWGPLPRPTSRSSGPPSRRAPARGSCAQHPQRGAHPG